MPLITREGAMGYQTKERPQYVKWILAGAALYVVICLVRDIGDFVLRASELVRP
jgi:hypothetical protein